MNEIADYLAPYPPEIRATADHLRALIKQTVPGVLEAVYHGWQLIGYRRPSGKGSRYFCFIAPHSAFVRLGFEWGVLLADPGRLLQGDGTQVRHLDLPNTAVFSDDLLTAYILEAAEVVLLNKEQKAALVLRRAADRERP
jgi:hypothetical protein